MATRTASVYSVHPSKRILFRLYYRPVPDTFEELETSAAREDLPFYATSRRNSIYGTILMTEDRILHINMERDDGIGNHIPALKAMGHYDETAIFLVRHLSLAVFAMASERHIGLRVAWVMLCEQAFMEIEVPTETRLQLMIFDPKPPSIRNMTCLTVSLCARHAYIGSSIVF